MESKRRNSAPKSLNKSHNKLNSKDKRSSSPAQKEPKRKSNNI
jgi:hypothetical protein